MSIDSIEDIEGEEIIFQGESTKVPEKESFKENSKKEIIDMDEYVLCFYRNRLI